MLNNIAAVPAGGQSMQNHRSSSSSCSLNNSHSTDTMPSSLEAQWVAFINQNKPVNKNLFSFPKCVMVVQKNKCSGILFNQCKEIKLTCHPHVGAAPPEKTSLRNNVYKNLFSLYQAGFFQSGGLWLHFGIKISQNILVPRRPWNVFKVHNQILKSILNLIGIQWSADEPTAMRSYLLAPVRSLSVTFCTCCCSGLRLKGLAVDGPSEKRGHLQLIKMFLKEGTVHVLSSAFSARLILGELYWF